LPFPKNRKFSGREDILAELHTFFMPNRSDITTPSERKVGVVHGMGRVGKTQIALQYAHLFRESYTATFWVDARNEGTMGTSCFHIVQELIAHYSAKYADYSDSDRNSRISIDLGILGSIEALGKLANNISARSWMVLCDWLGKVGNTKWLLLVDNNDDQNAVPLDFLPTCEWGNIIITSRNRKACEYGLPVFVPIIAKESGVELLLKGAAISVETLSQAGEFQCPPGSVL